MTTRRFFAAAWSWPGMASVAENTSISPHPCRCRSQPCVRRSTQASPPSPTRGRPGAAFAGRVGGRLDPSAGDPVALTGTIEAGDWSDNNPARHWMSIRFGRNNLVVLTPYLTQIMYPQALSRFGIATASYKVFAIKSRVHFRRGFDDSGFAPTILLVEPDAPFLGTIRLEALPYRNLNLTDFYPYGRDTR